MQQNNESLFGNIKLDGFDNELLVVDVTPGSGEPGDDGSEKLIDPSKKHTTDESKKPPVEKEIKKPVEDLIEVDTGPTGEQNQPDNKKAADTKGGDTPSTEENDSPVYLHAAALQENGVLPELDLTTLKDLEPADAILKINEHIQKQISDSINEGVEEFKSNIGEKALEFMEALEKGVPFEDLSENYTLEDKYGRITTQVLENDENLQSQIYSDLLTMKGFSEAKIKKMVDVAIEKDELLSEAVDGLKEIQSEIVKERQELHRQAEIEKKTKEEQNTKTKETIKKTVTAVKEIIPGIELTESEKNEIVKMMTVPVRYIKKGNESVPVSAASDLRSKNPIAFEMRLNYFIKNGFFNDDAKFDTLLRKTESKAAVKLIEKLNGERPISGKSVVEKDKSVIKKEKSFMFPQNVTNY